MSSLFDFQAYDLHGELTDLSAFHNHVALIVNTASHCGFTPQYRQLEQLYLQYKDQGLVILGFPCNQFGGQEPGSEAEISDFCVNHYSVSFPMFAKIKVNGNETHPLFRYLKEQAPGLLGTRSIKWNFTKFLTRRDGSVYRRYSPYTTPLQIETDIQALLA